MFFVTLVAVEPKILLIEVPVSFLVFLGMQALLFLSNRKVIFALLLQKEFHLHTFLEWI